MLHNSFFFFFWLRNNSFVSYVGSVRVHPYLPTKKRVHPLLRFYFIFPSFIGWVSPVLFTKREKKNGKKQGQFDFLYFRSDTLVKLLWKTIFLFRKIIHSFHFISLYHSEIRNNYFIYLLFTKKKTIILLEYWWVIYFCTILYMSLFFSLSQLSMQIVSIYLED